MKLVASLEKYTNYIMIPNFKEGYPFSKELFTVKMGKTEIKMSKPLSGQALFHLTETLTYEFYYDYKYPK